jgi:DNA repair photolyase
MAPGLQRTSSVSDIETVFHAEGSSTAEVETLSVKALLEANGIPTVLVGDPVLPNLPFEIKVDRRHAARARQLIAEADRRSRENRSSLRRGG